MAPVPRVLLVDDNPDCTMTLALILRFENCEVEVANNGFVGLEKARSTKPEVVLLDIGMPGMSGYELARHLRRLPEGRQMTIVAVTGHDTESDRALSVQAGIDRHIKKPADPDALLSLVKEVTTRRSD